MNADLPGVRDVVRDEVKEVVKRYRRRGGIFLAGFASMLTILVGTDLFTKADIIRGTHRIAFPEPALERVAVSYESFLELRKTKDSRSATRSIAFYAEPQQRVKVYARVDHRFAGNQDLRRVLVTLDRRRITGEGRTELAGAFHDVTDRLEFSSDFSTQPNVHSLTFKLDDSQPDSLRDELSIVCVILVYGNTQQ